MGLGQHSPEMGQSRAQGQPLAGTKPVDDGHLADHTEETTTEMVSDLDVVPPADTRSLRRRVIDLAWPVIGENFLETFLGIVDTLMVARLGAEAIAGVGSAIQVLFFVISSLSALSVGSAVLVAQAFGARNYYRAGQLARQSMLWSAIFGIPLGLVGIFLAEPIIGMFGMEPAVTQIGVEYLQVTMGTAVALTGLLLGGGVLRGVGDSRTPMMVRGIANVINVGLSYGLIFGQFGLPELGAVGSAWGTFMARTLALALLVGVLWRGRNGVSIRHVGRWLPDFGVAKQVLQIGMPAALEQVLISTAFLVLTVVVAGLGTATLAAHRIAMNATSLSFLPGIGFGLAATSLVGQSIGARRPDEAAATTRIATNWAFIWMTTMGVITIIFAPQLMGFFTDDPAVVGVGAAGLRVVAFAQPFWAIFFVQSGGLRGTGNTKLPLRVNATGIWCSVILAYSLIQLIGGSLAVVWAAFLVTAPGMAAILWWRFRRAMAKEAVVPVM